MRTFTSILFETWSDDFRNYRLRNIYILMTKEGEPQKGSFKKKVHQIL